MIKLNRNNTNFQLRLFEELKKAKWDNKFSFLKYYQNIVRYYVNNIDVGTKGLLVYHETGTGKSIVIVAIAMDFIEKGSNGKKVIFLLSKSLHQNLRKAIKKYVRLRNAVEEYHLALLSEADLDLWIDKHFSFVSMNASNMISQLNKATVAKEIMDIEAKLGNVLAEFPNSLDDTVVLIDEAHNLFRSITNGSKNAIAFYNMIMEARRNNIFFFTGTPINSSSYEMVPCMNMLSASRTTLPEDYIGFTRLFADERGFLKNRAKFQNRLFGLVSCAKRAMEFGKAIGLKVDAVKAEFPEELPLIIEEVKMSSKQFSAYRIAYEAEQNESQFMKQNHNIPNMMKPKSNVSSSYHVRTRMISNFYYDSATKSPADVPADNLESPKFAQILKNIKKHANQLQIIYSQFVGIAGLGTFARFLAENGFEEYTFEYDKSHMFDEEKISDDIVEASVEPEDRQEEEKIDMEPKDKQEEEEKEEEKVGKGKKHKNSHKKETILSKIKFKWIGKNKIGIIENDSQKGYAKVAKNGAITIVDNGIDKSIPRYVLIKLIGAGINGEDIQWGGIKARIHGEKAASDSDTEMEAEEDSEIAHKDVAEIAHEEAAENGLGLSQIKLAKALEEFDKNTHLPHIRAEIADNGMDNIAAEGIADVLTGEMSNFITLSHALEKTGSADLRKFAFITGAVPFEIRQKIIDIYSSDDNKHGEIIQLLLISSSGAEGLDLKNVRVVHIMEPYWNWARVAQVIARAVRNDSHILLGADEKNVQPYIYLAIAYGKSKGELVIDRPLGDDQPLRLPLKPHEKEGTKKDDPYVKTIDLDFYERMILDREVIKSYVEAIEEVSIECLLNGEERCCVCSPNNKPLFTADIKADVEAPNPCSQHQSKTVEASVVEYDGKKYYYSVDKESIYGFKIFQYDEDINSYRPLRENTAEFVAIIEMLEKMD